MLGGGGSGGGPCAGDELLTVTVVKDEHGYGMKVSGDNPVYVQSVKEGGAAWRAGLRAGDRILRVDSVPVHRHTHQQVVHMIRANPTTVLTVHQNASRHKTPITAPLPVNPEKQRQLEASKVHTVRLMLEQEQKYMRDLRNDLSKVPDVRKQAQLESAEQRCSVLQKQIDSITAGQPHDMSASYPQPNLAPATPRLPARTKNSEKLPGSPPPNSTGFLSGLPRSLSNLTGQSLRNLRQARQNSQKNQQENQPPLVRQNSDDNHKRRHNNTVPMVPTTCLDNTPPPPLPPRSIERPKRSPFNPHSPVNPLAKPNPVSPIHKQYYKGPYHHDNKAHSQMHQSMPAPYREDSPKMLRRSSHSLDSDLDGPQPNSIALQMSYPLINAPPPPLKTDNRTGVPVLHVRSQSSPEHLDHGLHRLSGVEEKEAWERGTPPPGTPPPPYAHNTQPCADPQRAIISMEEDDPPSDNPTYSGLFSNLNSVRESKARMAVLLNWLLGERRCACAALLLILTDGYRSAVNVTTSTLRRWAYEIHSTFIIPNAVLQLSGVDENMANEIEHILVNEYEKEELLRNVFRKARQKAKEELSQQLTEFQVKRQVGLGTLYGPDDALIQKCETDKAQELVVVERIMYAQLSALGGPGTGLGGGAGSPCATTPDALAALLAALHAAALCLSCRPASVSAAAGAARPVFLLRDKPYKQRLKHLSKQNPQPFITRGHHLQLQELTSVADCHHCDNVVWGLAPQAYVCNDCKLRVHRACARHVEEPCCVDHSRTWLERMQHNQNNHILHDKKPVKKTLGSAHFIGVERGQRRTEDEPSWEQSPTHALTGDSRREGSADEQAPSELDVDPSDVTAKDLPEKEHSRLAAPGGRGVNRAESCRERDAPRRGKHRNASDPNRLTAHNHHDLEPGAATAPSGSSSSSSLSSRSNESNTVAAEQQASQSDWSEEDEPLAAQWADSLPPRALDSLLLSARLRKRQEVIHELITSEGSHVRWLKVLGFVFLQPLESQPSLLPPEELRALFPNLPGVRERHAKLYADLKAARSEATNHVVQIRPIADAMLNTLGESGYAACLSKFCRGQRMALEQLRERRRKHKELHQFLASKEQLPLCGRLQLRDLLACVWQRLTKYQLLLESILKTVCDADPESAEDISRLRLALDVAKDVLHGVDTAIRTAENQHRLRTIQSKLEVRASGLEWEELRRLDLTQRALRMEGDLSIRCDSNKKINVLALMLSDSLVLLQREGDKFVLKPFSQPSQQSHLSPLIKWDKVLFRPNAAARNTFFLMNINGVQMHELSANAAAEYATWVKNIQECPLAMTDLKPIITPSHHSTKSNDDSGINVSRNPSDASEKSEKSSSTAHDDNENERDRASLGRSSTEREDRCERDERAERDDRPDISLDRSERDDKASFEREDRGLSQDKESIVSEREDRHKPRRPTVGLVSQHGCSPAPLEPSGAVRVAEPAASCLAHTATRAFTHQERLRRLDERIAQALRAKSAVVAELLGVDKDAISQVADLAVAETLGQLDVSSELHAARLDRSSSIEDDLPSPEDEGQPPPADMHQLLLAAQAQANQLTEALTKALSVSESSAVAARVGRSGRCDSCRRRQLTRSATIRSEAPDQSDVSDQLTDLDDRPLDRTLDKDMSFDMLSELDARTQGLDDFEGGASAAGLASKLVGVTSGLQSAVGRLLAALPGVEAERRALRRELAALREANDALRARHARAPPLHDNVDDYEMTEEMCFPKESVDRVIQDQPSNGG